MVGVLRTPTINSGEPWAVNYSCRQVAEDTGFKGGVGAKPPARGSTGWNFAESSTPQNLPGNILNLAAESPSYDLSI